MSVSAHVPPRDAVILAAGNGDRFHNADHRSKLLHPVLGEPLILRTIETALAAGIQSLTIVLGYEADRVRQTIERHPLRGATVRFAYNPDWHLENGVSALSARPLLDGRRFALLMGDHLFDASALRRLVATEAGEADSLLAVDRTDVPASVSDEATKVRIEGDRIVAIGKGLPAWDALDTGLFVFTPALFGALDEAVRDGETTLSAGVQRLAARRLMRAVEIGALPWCDVDTVDDLQTAEKLFASVEPEHA